VADAVLIGPVSGHRFPANREKNREFCNLWASQTIPGANQRANSVSWQHNSLDTETGNLFASNRESIRRNSEILELNRVSGVDVCCDAFGHPVLRLASLKRRASPLIPQLPTNRCIAASEVIGQQQTHAAQQMSTRMPSIRLCSVRSSSERGRREFSPGTERPFRRSTRGGKQQRGR
jgi:hypothetical protein